MRHTCTSRDIASMVQRKPEIVRSYSQTGQFNHGSLSKTICQLHSVFSPYTTKSDVSESSFSKPPISYCSFAGPRERVCDATPSSMG